MFLQPDERTKTINEARATMRRIGLQLIRDKREAILRARDGKDGTEDGIAKKDVQGRDLLSLLIKANLATDVPEDQRLSEEQVLSREFHPIPSPAAAPLTLLTHTEIPT